MNYRDPPRINLEVLSQTIIPEDGFTRICRSEVKFHYEDGSVSNIANVNHIVRTNTDAVVILPHYWNYRHNQRMIYLRSAVRPALQLHDYLNKEKVTNSVDSGNQWELAAGLIEPNEDPQTAASRECEEELGFIIPVDKMNKLGSLTMVSAGIMPERLFFFETTVNPTIRSTPSEDGSPFEKFGEVLQLPLADAIRWVEEEKIVDTKTEIGLLRLAKKYGY